ncbi:MAG TPA: hypothetical protein VF669_00760 [Tepidisphaeraceae bacterium]|jgi:ELWxxDGT repeat protein
MAKGSKASACASVETLEKRQLLSVDLLIDAAGLGAEQTVSANGATYFFANNGVVGRELWKSDGSVAGTTLVKDVTPGKAGTETVALLRAGDRALFVTVTNKHVVNDDPLADYSVWASDGAANTTVPITQFLNCRQIVTRQFGDRVAIAVTTPSQLTQVDGHPITDASLYFTDGTVSGTVLAHQFVGTNSASAPVNYNLSTMAVASGKLIFSPEGRTLWSSDGTAAGTIDLSPAIGNNQIWTSAGVNLVEANGKVLIPGQWSGKVWITDGTLPGTVSRSFDNPVSGSIVPNSTVVTSDAVYFVEDFGGANTVWKLSLDGGNLQSAFTSTDASRLVIGTAGDRVYVVSVAKASGRGGALYVLKDGDFRKIGAFAGENVTWVRQGWQADLNGTFYFVLQEYYGDPTGAAAKPIGKYRTTLYRSDGTPAGTGFVKTLYNDQPATAPDPTLRVANGKLVVEMQYYRDLLLTDTDYKVEEAAKVTTVYDPAELTLGRNGATARLINGILRVDGSLSNDKIQLWRSARDPGKLVVAYNGNERTFPFNSIRRTAVDLQSGDDYFEILEGDGGAIRLRTSVFGGDGTDTIITGTGRDIIFGGGSGDLIKSRGNADVINGGSGRDRINAGLGDDEIAGGSGSDQVLGGGGVDILFGQNAVEMAFGKKFEGEDLLKDVLLS